MDKISREQIERLIDIQEKETEADQIQSELEHLPVEYEKKASLLKQFEGLVDEKEATLNELKKTYRSYDAEIESNQERIKKRDIQLRSVKTNKEYQAVLKDIEEIKKANSKLEDETIECLDRIDGAEKEMRLKQEEHVVHAEVLHQKKKEMQKKIEEKQLLLNKLLKQRDIIAEGIDAELLKEYYFIKSQARGTAIVEAKDSVCFGCHMNIPPQMYNELHRGNELRSCPHCHRMLYIT